MSMRIAVLSVLAMVVGSGSAQTAAPAAQNADAQTTLRITSRAVLVDVLVTDKKGKPVKGLPQSAFAVTEQGRPQTISFFEEHTAGPIAPVSVPKLPQNVFSNYSAYPLPPAINVILLDSLNTRMASQMWVHSQALKFLANTKPGTEAAVFTMGLGLHFIQGFTSDPALLAAAVKNKKNNNIEQSVMVTGQDESNGQANLLGMMGASAGSGPTGGTVASPEAIAALSTFFAENESSRQFDRFFVTLENLQRLAAFLNSFPGRKNVIWFTESVPAIFLQPSSGGSIQENPSIESELKKTLDMLSAARVAIYPVDARGVQGNTVYNAETVLPNATSPMQMAATLSSNYSADDQTRNADQAAMEILANETGGRAFKNTNGLGQVMDTISDLSSDFYTLSYTPTNERMDGAYRSIDVKVPGGKYTLFYRRGYFALDRGLPGGALETREQALHELQQKSGGNVDPLLPFMDLGMPQSDQILYEAKVNPLAPAGADTDKSKLRYGVDFAIDLSDLKLTLDSDGVHRGVLNVTLLIYDRYGNIVNHQEHLVALDIKPDVYPIFQTRGVQLHSDIATPKGNYWLRTGIYDVNSHKVGTLEIPLAAVKPLEANSTAPQDVR